jgi:outer membrane immunogenic protein
MGPALAADVYAPPVAENYKDGPVYAPATSWTGFYAGINGGYGWSAKKGAAIASAFDHDLRRVDEEFNVSTLDRNGGFGGGQIGYNWQQGHFVFGLEADLQGSGISGSARTSVKADPVEIPDSATTANTHTSLDWFSTVRGRLGYAFDRTLIYGTGGFAFGGVKERLTSFTNFKEENNLPPAFANRDATRTGYVLGGGLEHALTPAWSLKAEYQYINLGSSSLSTTTENPDAPQIERGSDALKVDHAYHTVRAGLNYHILPAYEPLK